MSNKKAYFLLFSLILNYCEAKAKYFLNGEHTDVENRAQLPKGIENIRPHLETMDNVPLLVSLFTDTTPDTTREMIGIMQEYGEVVCVMGSAANYHNVPVFLQVWSLTQFYSVDFSKSRIGVKKCVFIKRTIKVCVSCF